MSPCSAFHALHLSELQRSLYCHPPGHCMQRKTNSTNEHDSIGAVRSMASAKGRSRHCAGLHACAPSLPALHAQHFWVVLGLLNEGLAVEVPSCMSFHARPFMHVPSCTSLHACSCCGWRSNFSHFDQEYAGTHITHGRLSNIKLSPYRVHCN